MSHTILLIAVVIIIAAIIWAISTDNSWKSVGITWILLFIGATLFGISLTI